MAQKEPKNPKDSLWTRTAQISLLANQSTFNNWTSGGANSLAGTLGAKYGLAYKDSLWRGSGMIESSYGLNRVEDNPFTRKTDDRLQVDIRVERFLSPEWTTHAWMNLLTQWAVGYKYSGSGDQATRERISKGFSPAYWKTGIGFTNVIDDTNRIDMALATLKMTFVSRIFTRDLAPGQQYFGVDANKTSRAEIGLDFVWKAQWKLWENVRWKHLLNIYSNYLDRPDNLDINYLLELDLKVNDFISTQFVAQWVYDDHAIDRVQSRQILGIQFRKDF
ncbi:MAG: DUF3078 domain-containing protein [Flavobacteriaceae bacterium]